MVLIDSMGRQVKGVLGNSKSTQDSFFDGNLEYPQYSRPEEIDGQKVPDVLLSGNQKNIDTWREEQSKLNTSSKRKDLLNKTEYRKNKYSQLTRNQTPKHKTGSKKILGLGPMLK